MQERGILQAEYKLEIMAAKKKPRNILKIIVKSLTPNMPESSWNEDDIQKCAGRYFAWPVIWAWREF